jgi:hypothetical protein
VVTVWSDFAIPGELDALRLRVSGEKQSIDHPFQLTATNEPGKYSMPIQLALVPAGSKNLSIAARSAIWVPTMGAGFRNDCVIVRQ